MLQKKLRNILICLSIMGALFVSGYCVSLRVTSSKMNQAIEDARKHKEEAERAYSQYLSLKPEVAKRESEIASIKKAVAQKDNKIAELERLVNHDPNGTIIPVDPQDQALADLANEQAKQITTLKSEVSVHEGLEFTLREQISSLNKAYKEQALRANLNEVALRASIAANKASYWKGVMHGLAVGVGGSVGYAHVKNK